MDITGIFDRTIFTSGQFILAKTKIEMDVDSFKILIEDCLEEYNKSRPVDKTFNIQVGNNGSYTFPASEAEDVKGRVPDWIAKVTPIRSINTLTGIILQTGPYSSGNSELIVPVQYPFVYNKPILTVSSLGSHEVLAVYNHVIRTVVDADKQNITNHYLDTITTADTWFLKLVKARFLQGIGMSRRAFTLTDIPITSDASELVSEGKELEETTLEGMHNNKKIHLGMG